MNKMQPKFRYAVSVVPRNANAIEFFYSNTRMSLVLKVEEKDRDNIIKILLSLDGKTSLEQIFTEYKLNQIEQKALLNLLDYLNKKNIVNFHSNEELTSFDEYRRIIEFLNDFATGDDLLEMWQNIKNSHVLIIGLGAVGSWVAINLVQSGVKKISLLDNDIVEPSNLHRQFSYKESQIGRQKTEALKENILAMNSLTEVDIYNYFLEDGTLDRLIPEPTFDLVINCADKPTVDQTSLWVSEYCLKHNIPHIIGGGYNLHLSLIGQTVLPFKSACVKCFEKTLVEENVIDTNNIKKLAVKNKKPGSFTPLCAIVASFIGIEAIKVLSKKIDTANINRRGEFNMISEQFTYKNYPKRDDCEWCGTNGKFIKR